MNNTNQQLFSIYQNIFVFYEYRNLISVDEPLTQADFAKKIQKDKYILLSAIDKSHADEITSIAKYIDNFNEKSFSRDIVVTHMLLIYPGTECESKRANMMKFVNHIRYPYSMVLIITPTKLSNSVVKGLVALANTKEHKHHTFKAYTYTLLNAILPKHKYVPEYKILSAEEVSAINLDPNTLPRRFEDDPQMVWIGAKIGQVIRYKYLSETTMHGYNYAVVVPSAN